MTISSAPWTTTAALLKTRRKQASTASNCTAQTAIWSTNSCATKQTFAKMSMVAAPKTVWLGGAIAIGYIIAIVVLTPRLGVGLTTGLILVGQIITALVLDHLGAFGNAQHTLNAGRLAGLALMIAGIATIKMY